MFISSGDIHRKCTANAMNMSINISTCLTMNLISIAIVLLDTSDNDTLSRRLSVLWTQCFASRAETGNLLLIMHYLYPKDKCPNRMSTTWSSF